MPKLMPSNSNKNALISFGEARVASSQDIPEIVRVTNAAYAIEQFCINGDRTNYSDIDNQMVSGKFLVIPFTPGSQQIVGNVFVEHQTNRGYMGMLAVDPEFQGNGISKVLVNGVEGLCRKSGLKFLDITILNLRTDLFPFYLALGFAPNATVAHPQPTKLRQPLHLIKMTKALYPIHEL